MFARDELHTRMEPIEVVTVELPLLLAQRLALLFPEFHLASHQIAAGRKRSGNEVDYVHSVFAHFDAQRREETDQTGLGGTVRC